MGPKVEVTSCSKDKGEKRVLDGALTVQKMKVLHWISSVNVTKSAVLVTFTEGILNEKFYFLCNGFRLHLSLQIIKGFCGISF